MGNPHVLVVPYPAQGHIIPLLELSKSLVKQGFSVIFVSTNHMTHLKKVKYGREKSTIDGDGGDDDDDDHVNINTGNQIRVALIRDGLSLEDRKRPGKLSEWVLKVMPRKVEELIEEIHGVSSGDDDHETMIIRCVVADQSLGWALDIAESKGIKGAAFCPAAAAMLVQGFSIPRLIDEGIINKDGTLLKKQIIKLSPEMPAMNTSNFVWTCLGNEDMQKNIFKLMMQNNNSIHKAQRLICNSTYDLEPAAFKLAPQVLPIGPLLSSTVDPPYHDDLDDQDTSTCLKWLDQQRPSSVIYVAFGSFAVLDTTQLQELALALELSNRPFLWVVRTGESNFPDGFLDRVANRAMVVKWAPQQRVLGHPSVACFVSHCGWNSIVEGVSNGLTFLCWPYFADQFVNQSYVCDVWRVGLGFDRDYKESSGVIRRDEIRAKLERVLGDEEMRKRALSLKELVLDSVKEDGESSKNFRAFVEWIKSQ